MDSNAIRLESHTLASFSGRDATSSGESIDVANEFISAATEGIDISIYELIGEDEDDSIRNRKRAEKLLKDRRRRNEERTAFLRLCDLVHVDYYTSRMKCFEDMYNEVNNILYEKNSLQEQLDILERRHISFDNNELAILGRVGLSPRESKIAFLDVCSIYLEVDAIKKEVETFERTIEECLRDIVVMKEKVKQANETLKLSKISGLIDRSREQRRSVYGFNCLSR